DECQVFPPLAEIQLDADASDAPRCCQSPFAVPLLWGETGCATASQRVKRSALGASELRYVAPPFQPAEPTMSRQRILIDGDTLQLDQIHQVADNAATVELTPGSLARVKASRALVERVAAGDAPAYGINTGFGTLAEVRIDKKDLRELQRNLLLSH